MAIEMIELHSDDGFSGYGTRVSAIRLFSKGSSSVTGTVLHIETFLGNHLSTTSVHLKGYRPTMSDDSKEWYLERVK